MRSKEDGLRADRKMNSHSPKIRIHKICIGFISPVLNHVAMSTSGLMEESMMVHPASSLQTVKLQLLNSYYLQITLNIGIVPGGLCFKE